MIQFNLLPDIKLEYIRSQRTKRTVMLISGAVTAVALVIFIVLLVGVKFVQPKHISNLTTEIKSSSNNLESTQDFNKILTVQNQLTNLTGIHEKKAATTRLLGFVQQFTPAGVSINNLDVDFVEHTVTVTGAAPTLVDVNKYVDTLKFTEYRIEEQKDKAFTEVVLTSFGKSDKGASYTISFKYYEQLFDNTKTVELLVPQNTISTRSEQEKPKVLFEPSTDITEGTR